MFYHKKLICVGITENNVFNKLTISIINIVVVYQVYYIYVRNNIVYTYSL